MFISCPCGQTLRADEAMAGKQVRCPACQGVLTAPERPTAITSPEQMTLVPTIELQPAIEKGNVWPGLNRSLAEDGGAGDEPPWKKRGEKASGSPLVSLLLAGGTGLLVMVVVTGFILLTRGTHDGASVTAAPPNGLKEFVCAEGKFRVMLPGTPREQTQRVAGITMKMFMVEQGGGAYMAAFADVPIRSDEPEWQTQQRLNGARDGALRNVQGVLVREGRIRLHGREPGREIEANLPNQRGVLRARFYIVGRRMYQVMVVGNRQWVSSGDADRFLNSLSLTK
jgi:hypothetical protein